jgi:hypothetical protein
MEGNTATFFKNCFKEFHHGTHANLDAKVTATSSIAAL